MPPQPQQQVGGGGQSGAPGGVFGLIACFWLFIGIAMWTLRHDAVARVWLKFDLVFVKLAAKFSDSAEELRQVILYCIEKPHDVTFGKMLQISYYTGMYYLPFALVLAGVGIILALRDPVPRLNKVHDHQSLLERLNEIFPHTTPILHKDLLNKEYPGWEVSVGPYEFAKKHKLLKNGRLDEAAAEGVFISQVGNKFSIDTMKPHEKALYAVFAAKIENDKEASQQLLEGLSRSWTDARNAPDYSLAEPLFQKYRHTHTPFSMVHSYTKTVLMSMFAAAKLRGKLAPAFFLWLKPVDRYLFYALNRVGAKTPFTEGSGAWNHWEAEQVVFTNGELVDWRAMLGDDEWEDIPRWKLKSRVQEIKVVWVKNAVQGLKQDLIDIGAIEDAQNQV